jgi:hypothetical protein
VQLSPLSFRRALLGAARRCSALLGAARRCLAAAAHQRFFLAGPEEIFNEYREATLEVSRKTGSLIDPKRVLDLGPFE